MNIPAYEWNVEWDIKDGYEMMVLFNNSELLDAAATDGRFDRDARTIEGEMFEALSPRNIVTGRVRDARKLAQRKARGDKLP